jgi:hypothetical protein
MFHPGQILIFAGATLIVPSCALDWILMNTD